jgi:hypothetical protein
VRVAVTEHAAVGRDQPVAVTGRRDGHTDDRRAQRQRARAAVEVRVTEGEDAAVGGDEVVAVARRRIRDADDRAVQVTAAHRSEEVRAPSSEDAAVRAREHVTLAARLGRDADDRRVRDPRREAEARGVTRRDDDRVVARQPVADATATGMILRRRRNGVPARNQERKRERANAQDLRCPTH